MSVSYPHVNPKTFLTNSAILKKYEEIFTCSEAPNQEKTYARVSRLNGRDSTDGNCAVIGLYERFRPLCRRIEFEESRKLCVVEKLVKKNIVQFLSAVENPNRLAAFCN